MAGRAGRDPLSGSPVSLPSHKDKLKIMPSINTTKTTAKIPSSACLEHEQCNTSSILHITFFWFILTLYIFFHIFVSYNWPSPKQVEHHITEQSAFIYKHEKLTHQYFFFIKPTNIMNFNQNFTHLRTQLKKNVFPKAKNRNFNPYIFTHIQLILHFNLYLLF